MDYTKIGLFLIVVILVFTIVHKIAKNKKPFRRALLSVLSGLLSLSAVNLSGMFTGVFIPVSLLSLAVSTVLGVPGTVMMLLLNLFF